MMVRVFTTLALPRTYYHLARMGRVFERSKLSVISKFRSHLLETIVLKTATGLAGELR